jgi:hypothetical protein
MSADADGIVQPGIEFGMNVFSIPCLTGYEDTYNFRGFWYDDPILGLTDLSIGYIGFGDDLSDITLLPRWYKGCDITFVNIDPDTLLPVQSLPVIGGRAYDNPSSLSVSVYSMYDDSFKNEGFVLAGWTSNIAGDGKVYTLGDDEFFFPDESDIPMPDGIMFTAVWEPVKQEDPNQSFWTALVLILVLLAALLLAFIIAGARKQDSS